MLKGVLAHLDEAGNPLPRFTAPRCLLERQAVGGCDACAAACPHQAVDFGGLGESVVIQAERCTGCGLCVQACPTGALEYNLLGPLGSLKEQQEAAGQRVPQAPQPQDATLTCAQSGAGGPNLPCLGRVTPALVAAAGAWGLRLALIHGDCAQCAVGAPQVPQRLAQVVDAAQRLRRATGQPAQVSVRPATPQDSQRTVQVSRRQAFETLLRAGRQHLAHSIPESPLPFVDWSVPEDRTPQEWRWRARTLKPTPPAAAGIDWPAPVVDDTCIDCPVCANVCPTEAITRDLTPEGGVRLLLNLSACTGCLACLRSCPPQAIREQGQWLAAAFDQPILLRESDCVM